MRRCIDNHNLHHRFQSMWHNLTVIAKVAAVISLVVGSSVASSAGAQTTPPAQGATSSPATPAREAPPPVSVPKDFKLPPVHKFELPNGLKVTLIPYGSVPVAAVQLSIRTGSIDEDAKDVSIASVTTDMLLEGTTTQSAQDISRKSADMGGAVSASAGSQVVTISGEVLSEFAPTFVTLIADVARNPKFDSSDLARVIDKHVRDNAMALAQPGTVAQKRFMEVMYGDHPFARTYPDESVLRGFSTEKVKAFYSKNFAAKRSHLYVSGVFNAKAVEKAIRDAFSTWTEGEEATQNVPTIAAKRQIDVIDRPGSVQSSIFMGVPAANPKSSDWSAMEVTNYLLGGAFGSRITANIREDKGYTYSPASYMISRVGAGLWVENADVTTKDTGPAINEIFKEMKRLSSEAPPEKELTGFKSSLAGMFVLTTASRNGLISRMNYADLYQLGDGYLSSYVKRVMAVNPEEVRATAEKYLDPNKVSIVMVADRKIVDPQLGQFKPIRP